METDSYIAFLTISTLVVIADAAIITLSGRRYLATNSHRSTGIAISWLTTTLFMLIVLGLVALISTVGVPVEGQLQQLVTKLGIVLLLLALAHAITMRVLSRYRGEEREEQLVDRLAEGHTDGDRNHKPSVTRSIEQSEPYSTS